MIGISEKDKVPEGIDTLEKCEGHGELKLLE